MSDSKEVGLQMVVSHLLGVGTQTWVLCESNKCFLTIALSLRSKTYFLRNYNVC